MPLNVWGWQGGNLATVVGSSEALLFTGPGGGFSTPLIAGDTLGQEATYVRHTVLGTSGGELPNCQFIGTTTAGVGGVTVSVNSINPNECTLRVRLTTHGMGAVGTTNSFFDAYGLDTTKPPAVGDVVVYGFEQGDSNWSVLSYINVQRLRLAAQATALMTHDWFIGVSARATAVGVFDDITFRVVTEYTS